MLFWLLIELFIPLCAKKWIRERSSPGALILLNMMMKMKIV